MDEKEQKVAAEKFVRQWIGRGYEKGESQSFWLSLLKDVYDVKNPGEYIKFEQQVKLDNTAFIDGYIDATKVMIEQKGINKDLRKPIKQSDGTRLTPFQQAKRYSAELPYSQRPRWIITSNFKSFLVYDMENPTGEPEEILLANLPNEIYRLAFLVDDANEHIKKEMELSIKAGEIVGKLYDAILKQYKDPNDKHSLKSLNMLCVRLVFCLYAEDAGIFGKRLIFHDYLKQYPPKEIRTKLIELFKILDTKMEERDPYLSEDLAAFPFVNGGLFSDESIEIPNFNDEILSLLLDQASVGFDWSQISPTIFGAVFESTINPQVRRTGGMHYTSIENIHKVIDPLFLDDLKKELRTIKELPKPKERTKKLLDYQRKLATLNFLDPACGSGNFLTETYISIRRLENKMLKALNNGQIVFGDENFSPIKVSIEQFYGIEINDFAVTVAKTALWIAESQMMKETEDIIHANLEFLPIKSYAKIVEGNALQIDWEDVIPKAKLNYIMGNPPFVGYSLQSKSQKSDILSLYIDENGKPYKTAGKIDYVAGWYFKAAQFMYGTKIKTALVSTNSITQGEQVASIWKPLYDRFCIHIDFAYRTFVWNNEASFKAHVYCVIIGFSCYDNHQKRKLFISDERFFLADNINPYLLEADNLFIFARNKPICDAPKMVIGSQPKDNGYLIFTEDDKTKFIKTEPQATKYIRPFMMGVDFINRKPRYCLWLVDAKPDELRKCPQVMKRIAKVKEFRLASKSADARKKAKTPTLFSHIQACFSNYLAIAKVSSERRRYIPIDYLDKNVIAGDKLFMIPDATIYHFGILTSNIHMAWMRAVCGRLKSDYSYSNTVVYNNFPWPTPTDEQRKEIESTAQKILDARALYPDSSLADLYDEITMPPQLRKAHQENDKAVMKAYGLPIKETTESSCVAFLMKEYQRIVEGL